MVELQARFDEESNIEWARALERQGVHVVHGLPGLKVHSEGHAGCAREGDTIRRYLHLATGNYNPTTAHLYTDMGCLPATPNRRGRDGLVQLFDRLFGQTPFHQAAGRTRQPAGTPGGIDPPRDRANTAASAEV